MKISFLFGQSQEGSALFAIAHKLPSTEHSDFIQFRAPFRIVSVEPSPQVPPKPFVLRNIMNESG